MPDPEMFAADVHLASGEVVRVEYPADSQQPDVDAIKAALNKKKLSEKCFPQKPVVRHYRNGDVPPESSS